MDALRTILGGFFHKQKLDKTLKVYQIFNVWEQAVGTRIARHSHPKKFQDGTLWITVDNSTWVQQLSLLSEDICRKVNQALQSQLVEKVRFQLGEVGKHGRDDRKERDAPPAWINAKLDVRTEQAIDQVVGSLSDEVLKERLKSLFVKNSQMVRHHDKE